MLEKKYPKAADSLDIDAILGWELWPGFMKIYGMFYTELLSCSINCGFV